MANTQAMCNSFKQELLNGIHAFGTTVVRAGTGADTFKAALYFTSATVNANTTVYSTTGEVTNTSGSGYTAGGVTTVWNAPAIGNASISGGTAFTTPTASFSWTALTITSATFDTVLIYNSTQTNKSVSVHNFGPQSINAGALTLTMPANAYNTALLQIS
jgi:hypothetical protein